MWPGKYWRQVMEGQEDNYFMTSNREEEEQAASNTSCTEISEDEYNAAKQAHRA